MWYAHADIEEAAKLLLPKERGLALAHISQRTSILPKYWYENEINEQWMYHFGRQILREWAKTSEEAFTRKLKNSPWSLWDWFFDKTPPNKPPWFVTDPYWIRNQQYQLLRMDWEGYKGLWPYYQPTDKVPRLVPSRHKGAFIIDGVPMNCDPAFLEVQGYLPRHFKARD